MTSCPLPKCTSQGNMAKMWYQNCISNDQSLSRLKFKNNEVNKEMAMDFPGTLSILWKHSTSGILQRWERRAFKFWFSSLNEFFWGSEDFLLYVFHLQNGIAEFPVKVTHESEDLPLWLRVYWHLLNVWLCIHVSFWPRLKESTVPFIR